MEVLERNKIRTTISSLPDHNSVWLRTMKAPREFQSTASASNILEANLPNGMYFNEFIWSTSSSSYKFILLNDALDSIRELPFEKLDMDPILEPTIQKAKELLNALNGESLPLYNVSPGRGGEILIELKKGEKEAEIFINEDLSIEQLIYDNNQLVFESEFQLALLRVIFK